MTGEEQSPVGEYADNINNEKSGNQDTVVRKGRGKFRGPGSENQPDQQQQATRPSRGREFDATSLRQYSPKSGGKVIEESQNQIADETVTESKAVDLVVKIMFLMMLLKLQLP